MILTDSSLYTLMLALAVLALSAGTLLYWINEPEKVKGAGRFAFKLILRLLSYPLCVVLITLMFAGLYLATIVSYTVRRVGSKPTTGFRLKASFDD